MRKIFTLIAMIAMATTANAQILKVYRDAELIETYTFKDANNFVFEELTKVTSITLSKTSAEIDSGSSLQLTATVMPTDATFQSVKWESSNTYVATVNDKGLVTALSAGTATITATATDGSGTSAACTVTVKSPAEAHEYVDLGLPSGRLWAKTNIGAEKISDQGGTFAWGETESKSSFNLFNYKYYKSTTTTTKTVDDDGFETIVSKVVSGYTKYVTDPSKGYEGYCDNLSMLTASDDAATVKWGTDWCMPTKDDWQELKDNCTWEWKSINGVSGYKVTSKTNSNYIFLPSTGDNYWSCTLAYYMSCGSGVNSSYRHVGRNIRPVRWVKATGITLSATTLGMYGSATLTATISPENTHNKGLEWTSSDETVAKVSNGLVVGVSEGTATITATAIDGSGVSATCDVTVISTKCVDLGLSIKWAICNVGADSPEDYGDYFAWGETTGYNSGKTTFAWSTYKWCNGSNTTMTKYCTDSSYGTIDNKTVLDAEDDAATANWGCGWRMPTKAEWQELIDNCTWTWTQLNGVKGYKVTSKKSGYTDIFIFLPAASLNDTGSYGYYWSNSLRTSFSNCAWRMNFDSDNHILDDNRRYCGYSVRAVCTE